MLDRRTILRGSCASAASLALGGRSASAADFDVVVIGAGAAGLAAAHELKAAGRKAVVRAGLPACLTRTTRRG